MKFLKILLCAVGGLALTGCLGIVACALNPSLTKMLAKKMNIAPASLGVANDSISELQESKSMDLSSLTDDAGVNEVGEVLMGMMENPSDASAGVAANSSDASENVLGYAPYTISGKMWESSEDICTVEFSEAIVKNIKITLYVDNEDVTDGGVLFVNRDAKGKEYDVTLIVLSPPSTVHISSGYYGESFDTEVLDSEYYEYDADGTFRILYSQGRGNEWYFGYMNDYSDMLRGGELISLDQQYYFIMYAELAEAAGLLDNGTGVN